MLGKLIVPDHSGHSTIEWDTEEPATIEEAKRMYQRLTSGAHNGLRYRAAKMTNGVDGEFLNEFDPAAGTIMFIAPMAGG